MAHFASYINIQAQKGITEIRVVCYQPSEHKHQCTKKKKAKTKKP